MFQHVTASDMQMQMYFNELLHNEYNYKFIYGS